MDRWSLRVLCAAALAAPALAVSPSLPAPLGSVAQAQPGCFYQRDPGDPTENQLICPPGQSGGGRFAAVAISKSRLTSGDAWGFPSREEAERNALAACAKSARDCEIADWVQDGCIALAVSKSDGAWQASDDDYVDIAEARALGGCQRSNGRSCVIEVHPCSND